MGTYRELGFRADRPRGYATIEGWAGRLRDELVPDLGVGDPLPGAPLLALLRKHRGVPIKGALVPVTYEVKEELPEGIEALTYYDKRHDQLVIALSEATNGALERDENRARFTLAHEVSHAFLHGGLLLRMRAIPHRFLALNRGQAHHRMDQDAEWQADVGASALLMPARGVASVEARHPIVAQARVLSAQYKVSLAAAKARLRNYEQRKRALLAATNPRKRKRR